MSRFFLFRISFAATAAMTLWLFFCPAAVVAVAPSAGTPDAPTADAGKSGQAAETGSASARVAPVPLALPRVEPAPAQGVQEVWDVLLQSRMRELRTLDAEMKKLESDLAPAGHRLNSVLSVVEQDYQRILSIARVSRGLPVELNVVVETLRGLQERLEDALAPLEGSLSSLQSRLSDLSLLDQGTSEPAFSGREESPELKSFLQRLSSLRARLDDLEARLDRVLTPARTTLQNMNRQSAQLIKVIPGLWRDYYLVPSGRLYDLKTWKNFSQNISVLQETFAVRFRAELPDSFAAWLSAILRGLAAFIPLYLLVLFSRRLAHRGPAALDAGWSRMSSNSLPRLCVGLACHFAAWTSDGETYHVLSVLGTLIMSRGQMALAWDLYAFNHPERPRRSPLRPLFAPLLGGLVLLLFNLPAPLLGGAWLLVLGASLALERRLNTAALQSNLVRNLLLLHTAVLWIAVGMTLLGWGRLSILVCMAYAALAVSIQQAVGILNLTNFVSPHLPQRGFKALISGVFLALAVPLVLVAATLATGLWALAYPGGTYLLGRVAALDFNVGHTSFNLIQVLFILSAFYVTRSMIAVGSSFLRDLPANGVLRDQSLVGPIQVAYTYLLWALFGLYSLSALGFSLTSLTVVAGGLSVGIGFGLQNIINNFVSGLLVIFGQTVREGDIIELNGLLGTVKRINVRSTIVETFDNASIFVPNSEFLSNRLTNWTRNGRMVRRQIAVGVAYGSDVRLVIKLISDIADAHPKVLKYPEPMVHFADFGSSTLNFLLYFWVADISIGLPVLTDLRIAMEKTFRENNIDIAFPQLDVHLKNEAAAPEKNHEPPSDDTSGGQPR